VNILPVETDAAVAFVKLDIVKLSVDTEPDADTLIAELSETVTVLAVSFDFIISESLDEVVKNCS
jgi:hypothetical protein